MRAYFFRRLGKRIEREARWKAAMALEFHMMVFADTLQTKEGRDRCFWQAYRNARRLEALARKW